MAIERALVSVYEKTGIVEFARVLAQAGVEVVSTGGTAKLLRESGVKVREVSELTGWPEMLGGRVKTLHPKVHGGILFRRNRPDDGDETRKHGIAAIDLVVVNLYPFEATAARTGYFGGRPDRKHRYRRTRHGALGGEEFRERGRGHRSQRLCRACWRNLENGAIGL